jgi:hypothetical protein
MSFWYERSLDDMDFNESTTHQGEQCDAIDIWVNDDTNGNTYVSVRVKDILTILYKNGVLK